MSRLFIAEKPSLAKAIAEGLTAKPIMNREDGFYMAGADMVTWGYGHLLEQANPDHYDPALKKWSTETLPIIPKEWKMLPKESSRKQLTNIGKLLKSCKSVVNAGDPDREGQLLIDEVLDHFKYKGNVERIWLSAIDPKSVTKALASLKPNTQYHNLRDSAMARARADWLVGLNLTRAYTIAAQRSGYGFGKPPISIGRVQTPVLALIVQREEDIRNFKPIDFYTITADIAVQNGKFVGKLKTTAGEPGVDTDNRLTDPNIARTIVNRVKGAVGKISRFETKRESDKAPLPFNLSSLQIYASSKWGMGAQKVLDTCQALYETHKITTYPRSDCEYLPENQLSDAPHILKAISGAFPSAAGANPALKSRAWNDKKVTAHHGLIPTSKTPNLAQLTADEKNVYEIICLHYIAQFYPDYVYDKTNIEATFGQPGAIDLFTATGRVDVSQGWRTILPAKMGKGVKGTEEEQTLPKSVVDEIAKADECTHEAKKTKPPSRFTEGTLIEAMTNIHLHVTNPEVKARLKETDGLGTEATRAGIIETIIARRMVTIDKKTFVPTAMGVSVISAAHPLLKDPGMTALWEGGLVKIASGEMTLDHFIDMQVKALINIVEFAKNVVINIPDSEKDVVAANGNTYKPAVPGNGKHGSCPSCGKPIAERIVNTGPNEGKAFLACSGFPVCKQRIEQPKLAKAA